MCWVEIQGDKGDTWNSLVDEMTDIIRTERSYRVADIRDAITSSDYQC